MQLVRQNDKFSPRWKSRRRGPARRRARGQVRAGVAVLVVAAIASGCASGADGGANPAPGQQRLDAPPARALDSYAHKLRVAQVARAAAAKRWGLAKTPLAAPPAPAKKPTITTRKGFEVKGQASLPPVFTTIPTKKKIVFLTIDDGAEKDPALLKMMSELQIPYTAFLSDYLVKEDYGYFKKMQSRGVVLNNHTLNHRYMPGLSYAGQRREICGMQNVIQKRYGKRPELFRPPYGNYNADTLRAAKSCGIKAVPLWASEAFADHMEWREWDRDLHPGDIILTHFRGREDWKGSMPDMVRKVMKTVTDKGYAVARLEDYL
ncbi:polysaccharide deacetylase family protein [Streptomyces sp. NPDC051214]|uniref:polysaccharide deacetylase family protein n=1 Tax=Streptomyces sp. NPDC051214 TaxID=3155282 RepID=UPI0034289E92